MFSLTALILLCLYPYTQQLILFTLSMDVYDVSQCVICKETSSESLSKVNARVKTVDVHYFKYGVFRTFAIPNKILCSWSLP